MKLQKLWRIIRLWRTLIYVSFFSRFQHFETEIHQNYEADNLIGNYGARCIFDSIKENSALKEIFLSSWLIFDKKEVKFNKENNSFLFLFTVTNEITDDRSLSRSILMALKQNSTLTKLILSLTKILWGCSVNNKSHFSLFFAKANNQSFGIEGARSIFEGLKTNYSLKTLNLRFSSVFSFAWKKNLQKKNEYL